MGIFLRESSQKRILLFLPSPLLEGLEKSEITDFLVLSEVGVGVVWSEDFS